VAHRQTWWKNKPASKILLAIIKKELTILIANHTLNKIKLIEKKR
jgi:hypothetical protein